MEDKDLRKEISDLKSTGYDEEQMIKMTEKAPTMGTLEEIKAVLGTLEYDEEQMIKMTEKATTVSRGTPEEIKAILDTLDKSDIDSMAMNSFLSDKTLNNVINDKNFPLETLSKDARDIVLQLRQLRENKQGEISAKKR